MSRKFRPSPIARINVRHRMIEKTRHDLTYGGGYASSSHEEDNPIVLVVVGLLALVAVSFVASVLLAVAGVVGLAVPSVTTVANALADGSDPCVTNVVSVAFVGSWLALTAIAYRSSMR